ncbi:uncharacterized protein LOC113337621 [Papaver somniferum]|uniref:uncharacterized protein LOC113283265 n=1 Tax=Papaver somniferum TaxID=3469 RepID=UPI000E6F598A|nr:uncharacterized protein LOC113283265 [Papaver somniferum]XP_026439037.1 uncharacterized protein LOC113337621 [Papaver somniferum]
MAGKCKGSFSTFRNVDGRIVTSADDEYRNTPKLLNQCLGYCFLLWCWCILFGNKARCRKTELTQEDMIRPPLALVSRYWDYSPCVLLFVFEELKGAVASAFVDFTTSPSSAE